MRRIAILLALGGCSFIGTTTPKGLTHSCMPNRGPAVSDTVFVASAAMIDLASTSCHGEDCLLWIIPDFVGTLVAAPFLVSAIYGFVKTECPSDDERPIDPAELRASQQRMHALERVQTLAVTAAEAARAGDCETVKRLDVQVKALDPAFHDDVFVRDVAIAPCLVVAPELAP